MMAKAKWIAGCLRACLVAFLQNSFSTRALIPCVVMAFIFFTVFTGVPGTGANLPGRQTICICVVLLFCLGPSIYWPLQFRHTVREYEPGNATSCRCLR